MTRNFDLPEMEDRSRTVTGTIARALRMTEGQLYTVVIALLFVTTLLLTGLPGSGTTEAPVGTDLAPLEVSP